MLYLPGIAQLPVVEGTTGPEDRAVDLVSRYPATIPGLANDLLCDAE